MKNKLPLYTSLIMAVLAAIFYFLSYPSVNTVKTKTEKYLHELEQKANLQLDSIHIYLHHSSRKNFVAYLAKEYANTFNEYGIAFFIYENDSLLFWTDNHPAVENYMLNVCLEKRLVKLKNGYYEVIRHPKNAYSSFQLYALVLIKNNFPYENKYLKNGFNKDLHIPDGVVFSDNEHNTNFIQITGYQGVSVFSLDVQEKIRNQAISLFAFLFLCVASFSLLLFLKNAFLQNKSGKGLVKWLASVLLVIALLCYSIFQLNILYIPVSLSYDRQNLYNLIVTFLASLLSAWGFSVVRKELVTFIKTRSNLIYFTLFVVLLFTIGHGLNLFLNTIFNKSYLSSDLSDVIFSSSLEIYLSYACVFLVTFCFVLLCEAAIRLLGISYNKTQAGIFFVLTAIAVFIHHILGQHDVLTAMWPGLLFLLIVTSKKLCTNNRFLYGILICLFISFFVAYLSIDQKNKSDYSQRLAIMDDLSDPQDDIAEHLFKSVETKILKDKDLTHISLKKDKTIAEIEQSILRKYFTGYWEKYHISVCLFDSLCNPLIQHSQGLYNNNTYFDELISTKLQPTACPDLYFNEQLKDKTFYLYKTPIRAASKRLQLYIVIESKKTHTYRSFPDLLLVHSSHAANTEYSSAVYKAGQLHLQQGRYEYPALFLFPDDIRDTRVIQQNGYSHLLHKTNEGAVIVVSKEYNYINDLFSTLGLLFFAGSTVFLLYSFYNSYRLKYENSLSIKIQHYSAIAILALFAPVAFSTISLVKKETEKDNTHNIKDKIETVSNYLNIRLADYDSLNNTHKDYVAYILAQTANLFKNDITLFHANGEYYTASLPKLFEEGLVSKKLNPKVYTDIMNTGENEEVLHENIGNLNFYSSYKVVKNKAGKNLCVVNLPYFAKQSELQSQLFGYLSALLNVYILAFMIVSIGIALATNWLTRPLRLLQNQFKQVGLNRKDHSIQYSKNDEIGLLISAYNNMLVQLQQSADMLAKSEREGAWKEMARQVAHEIKNPLTPMKLSIQHVQRLMESNTEGAAEQMKKIIPILLEQIDALSHIATEFSDFWKLPPPHFENIELNSFIKSEIPLYDNQASVLFDFIPAQNAVYVKADKDQLLRVLNNLINNAIQALQENKQGRITISVSQEKKNCTVSVSDNGTGIDDSVKANIFQPNFSTKSYGTGLGLAMCKRIIEQHGGHIWFESEQGKGTTFYFTILNGD